MIELLLNELLNTFPFHFLAYIPFYKKLKYSPWEPFSGSVCARYSILVSLPF